MVMEYLWFMFTRVTGIFKMTENENLQDSSYHTNFVNFRFRNLVGFQIRFQEERTRFGNSW